MPNIRTYSNQLEGPRATSMGADATANAAYHIGQDYADVGREVGGAVSRVGQQYVEHNTRLETTSLGADLATAHAELAVQWNEIANKTDPKDIAAAAADFRDKIAKPRISGIGEKLETEGAQDMFARASAGIYDDIFQKTAADTAHLQGVGAASNVLTMKNQGTAAVFADPGSFASTMDLMHLSLDGMQKAFGLPSDKRVELQAEIDHDLARSAALGMLQRNPTQGKIDIADGRFDKFLTGEELAALGTHADELVRAQSTADKAAEAEQRRQQKDAADTFGNSIQAQMLQPDGSLVVGPTTAKDAVNYSMMPGVSPGEGRAMIDMVARITKDAGKPQKVVSDPHTYQDLMDRAILPNTDPRALSPTDIYRAVADGHLSQQDASFIKGAFDTIQRDPVGKMNEKSINDFLKGMKSTITKSNPMMNFLDGNGDRNFYDFSVLTRQTVAARLAKGDKLNDILTDLRTDALPHFQIGAKQGLAIMQNTFSGKPQSLAPVTLPAGAARKPGESMADWSKRTGL